MAIVARCCGEGAPLEHLSLNNASAISDRTLVSLAEHAAGVPSLYLSFLSASLIPLCISHSVSTHFPAHPLILCAPSFASAGGLQTLDLSWCRKLTDEGLGHLTDRCEALRSLKLWGCSQLTPVFLNGHRRHALTIEGRPSRPPLADVE